MTAQLLQYQTPDDTHNSKFNIIALNSIWIQFLDNEICTHTTDTRKLHERIVVNTCLYVTFSHFINVKYFNPKFSYVLDNDDMFSIQVTMSIWCLSYLLFL